MNNHNNNEYLKLLDDNVFDPSKDNDAFHHGVEELTGRIGDGIHTTPVYVEESEIHFINGNNLAHGRINISEQTKCVSKGEFLKHKRSLNQQTLLLSINGTIGSVAYYNGERVVLGKSAAYINCNGHLNKNYAFNVLSSKKTSAFFRGELTGSTIKNLSLASIRLLPIPVPSLPEQKAIAGVLGSGNSEAGK